MAQLEIFFKEIYVFRFGENVAGKGFARSTFTKKGDRMIAFFCEEM